MNAKKIMSKIANKSLKREYVNSFEIRYDVDMPAARARYPFAQMREGGSIEIFGDKEARKVRNAAYQYAKKTNREAGRKTVNFALRFVDTQRGEKVFRLWRTL